MTRSRRTYLVTGARAPAALEVIRRLGRAGHDVLAADSAALPVGRFSRYVRRYFRVPTPRTETAAFLAALRRVVQTERVDVLLPTCEEIYYISRYREQLADLCEVFCADFGVLENLHHKERFARLTHAVGGPVVAPESRLIVSASDLAAFEFECQDWVFKPVFSRFAARTLIQPSAARLRQLNFEPGNPWLAQRYIAGDELSSYAIAVRGNVVAQTLYQSHYRSGQGAGTYFIAAENAAVSAFVERLVAHLNFTGQIAFDFMVCSRTGNAFVLECNPRLTSGVHLFAPGFDLDGALRGEQTDLAADPQRKMLGAAMLSQGFGHSERAGKMVDWRRDFAAARDVVFASDDRWPAFGQLLFLGEMGWRALRQGSGLTDAMTADIEWNGATLS